MSFYCVTFLRKYFFFFDKKKFKFIALFFCFLLFLNEKYSFAENGEDPPPYKKRYPFHYAILKYGASRGIFWKYDLRYIEHFLDRNRRSLNETLNEEDENGDTPLILAIKSDERDLIIDYLPVIKLLIRYGAHINHPRVRYSIIRSIVNKGFVKIDRWMFNKGFVKIEEFPLHVAVRSTRIRLDVIQSLIFAGAFVNVVNYQGNTPFHMAVANEQTRPDIIQFLLNSGADVNVVNHQGDTPLHVALANKKIRLEVIQLLLDSGADVNAINRQRQGNTPLHMAVANEQTRPDIVQFLLDSGADVNVVNHQGNTPLHMAVANKKIRLEIIQLLLDYGADVGTENRYSQTPLDVLNDKIGALLDFFPLFVSTKRRVLLEVRKILSDSDPNKFLDFSQPPLACSDVLSPAQNLPKKVSLEKE